MAWRFGSRGKLFLVADISGALLRVVLPLAWGLAFSDIGDHARIAWMVLGVLFIVRDVTLSAAVRRERAVETRVYRATTVDGVTLSPEDAEKVRTIIDEARAKQMAEPMQ